MLLRVQHALTRIASAWPLCLAAQASVGVAPLPPLAAAHPARAVRYVRN